MKFSLPDQITKYFPNHPAHIVKNLLITVEGIFSAKSTNFYKVKDELGVIMSNQQTTKPESNYKRLIRFFQLQSSEQESIIKSLLCVSFCILGTNKSKLKYLVLDGTSWEFGCKKIHLLTLSVVIQGVSIPICWEDLDKKGISNYDERKALLDKACRWYNLKGMILLADREYIGEQWFCYLTSKGLDFIIRLKRKVYKDYIDSQCFVHDDKYHFKHQKWRYMTMEKQASKSRYIYKGVAKEIQILDHNYSFVIFKNPKATAKEKLLYFISSLKNKKTIITTYPIRWSIECCFKHLKSNGFNLEDINFKNKTKIKWVMAMVTFLYVLCIEQGLLAYKQKIKSDFKKYSNGKITLAVSVFRKGLAIVKGKFYDLFSFVDFLEKLIHYKSIPKWIHVQ